MLYTYVSTLHKGKFCAHYVCYFDIYDLLVFTMTDMVVPNHIGQDGQVRTEQNGC